MTAGSLLVVLLAAACGVAGADGGRPGTPLSTGSESGLLPGLGVTRGQIDQAVQAGAAGDFVGVQVGIWHNGRATVRPTGVRMSIMGGRSLLPPASALGR